MRKILAFLLLTLICVGGWAETQVIATMSDLVRAATHNDATVSTQWSASNGVVYQFGNNTYIGGITNETIKGALGSKFVTVAAWVYGRPSGCIFGYGDNGTGVKFMLSSTTFKTTMKSKADYQTQAVDAVKDNQWNLVAFTINTAFNETRYISGHQGHFGYYYTKGKNGGSDGMNTPEEAGQLFAIGSGDQGTARESFTGLIANVTVIASDAYLTNADKVADLVGAAPSPTAVVAASNLDDLHNAKWYNLTVHGKYITYNASENRYKTSSTKPTDNTGWFAFVGDNANGYKILNYAAGPNVAMGAANVNTNTALEAKSLANAQSFVFENVTYSNNPAWQIRQKDGANAFINDGANDHGNNLIYWNADKRGDYGNVFTFAEVADEAYYYVTYNVTATNGAQDPITWTDNQFVSTTQTTPSYNPSYSYFSDYTIINTQNKTLDQKRDFQVTAQHTLPMVPGKFYQIKQGTTYLQRQSESVVSLKAANDQTNPANLWYIKTAPHAPYFYLYNVESEKAVNALNNSAAACTEGEVADPLNYLGTIYSIEFKKIGDNFQMFKSGTTQNLGSHGTLGSTANHALGLWNNGDTQFSSEEFNLALPTQESIEEHANYVGNYVSSSSYYDALNAYNSDKTSVANLKSVLAAYNSLETIDLTENKYYRLRNVGSIAEEASGNKYPYSWLTSTLSDRSGSNRMTMNHDAIPGADAIFYYNGNNLVSYNTGLYASGNTISEQAYDWTIEEGENRKFYLKNGSDYLTYWGYDDNGGQVHRDALMKSTKEDWAAWYLQEVPMYTVSINDFEATVQTGDGVQVKNGGKLYVAAGAELTATAAKEWYTSNIVKNDAAKTVTVTYSDPSGYYFIKDSEGNYATNNFAENATAFGEKVNAYNGMWKATFDEDTHTVTINSGVGTPLYVDENTYNVLTLTAQNKNGTFTATTEGGAEWTLEPVNLGAKKIANVTIFGDEGTAWVIFNHNGNEEHAKDGGFFLFSSANDFGDNYGKLSGTEIDNKNKTISVKGIRNSQVAAAEGGKDITLAYANSKDLVNLKKEICEVFPLINTLGYPKIPSIDEELNYTVFEMGFLLDYENEQGEIIPGADIEASQYAEFVQALNILHNATDVVLPTAGGFYTLTNYNGESKTYYFTENSELLSYDNGLFTKIGINGGVAFVDYADAGTTTGEEFEFSKSTAGFGKLAAWQIGEGPLPSGDGRINSGWTITKTEPSVKMNNINDVYYASMYMPTAVKLPVGVEAYEGKISNDGTSLKLTQINLGGDRVLAAKTPVVLISESEISAADLIVSDTEGVGANENNFEGTVVTMPQDGTSTYYVLNTGSKGAGFYKYKAGKNLNGFKAYYAVNGVATSNAFSFEKDDDLTALEDAVLEVVTGKAPIRDLQGNIITNPIKGQIYIQNGKAFKY